MTTNRSNKNHFRDVAQKVWWWFTGTFDLRPKIVYAPDVEPLNEDEQKELANFDLYFAGDISRDQLFQRNGYAKPLCPANEPNCECWMDEPSPKISAQRFQNIPVCPPQCRCNEGVGHPCQSNVPLMAVDA